jgi:dTMP kinase
MLISFEGIEGCGKSTQEKLLADWLQLHGQTVHRVREPGGTPLSESVRTILLDPTQEIDPFAEMLLFSAARAQLCRTRIKDWHRAGDVILCDRFFDSTVAYQGGGRGVADPEWIRAFQLEVTGGLIPDRTYYFRLDLETARSRLSSRGNANQDRMEASGSMFFERVITAYDRLADANPERIRVLDARKSIPELAQVIIDDISALLGLGRNSKSNEL